MDKGEKENKILKMVDDILNPPKKGKGLRAQIIDGDYKPTTNPIITQQDFEDFIFSCTVVSKSDDFYFATQAGWFMKDKDGNWFARVDQNETEVRDEDYDYEKIKWLPCLSPFLDEEKLTTRSEVIFIKE